MELYINQDWNGATDAEDAYCSYVTLADNEEWMRQELKDNMDKLGVCFYEEHHTGVLVVHGKFIRSDISEIHKGQLPVKRESVRKYPASDQAVVEVDHRYL